MALKAVGINLRLVIGAGAFIFSCGLPGVLVAQPLPSPGDPLSVWHNRTPTNQSVAFKQVVFGGDQFLAFGLKRTNFNQIWASSDGAKWTGHSTGTTNEEFNSVAFGNGTYVALGCSAQSLNLRRPVFNTTIVISTNGNNWQPVPLTGNSFLEDNKKYVGALAFGGGKFMMLGNEPDARGMRKLLAWTSTDGREWKAYRPNLIWPADMLYYLGDRFLSVDSIGRVLSIQDLDLWTQASNRGAQLWRLKSFAPLSAATYGHGKFVVVGNTWDYGVVATSTDAKEWTEIPIPPVPHLALNKANLNAVAFGGNTFLATGFNCTVIVSQNGTDWKHLMVSTNRSYSSVAYGKGTFVLVGGNYEILQSDPLIR